MKILNREYRNIQNEVLNKTPISELDLTSEFDDKSYLHLVQFVEEGKYTSMRIRGDTFKQKVYEAVQNTFKTEYWDTHEFNNTELKPSDKHDQDEDENGDRPEGTSFKALVDYLKSKDNSKKPEDRNVYTPTEVPANDPDGFVKHIYYDFDVLKRYMVLNDAELEEGIGRLGKRVTEIECHFAPEMKFHTTWMNAEGGIVASNSSVNHTDPNGQSNTDNDTYCQMTIADGNKISNTWSVPATGNLVVYGWLDSGAVLNNKAIPSSYCVIEGKINGDWEIIGAQPVIPFKNITYVGFTLPVKKNLLIRVRTGFTVGAKSGQFSNNNDGYDTLANSAPNGFKCMVFSNSEYEENVVEDED